MARREDECVDMERLAEGQLAEELMCSICLQFMVKPYRTNCHGGGKHLYGYNCIKKWKSQCGGKKLCPLCRTPFTELFPYTEFQERIQCTKAICKDCNEPSLVRSIIIHQSQCPKRQERIKSQLADVVSKEISYLLIEITPHLKEHHSCIFEEHVRGWEWLLNDPRNWKWWWWANMPWWKNQSCETCNDLWHKYEKDVDREEAKRIELLAELGIAEEKKEAEGVKCQSQ